MLLEQPLVSLSGHTCDVLVVAAGRGQRFGGEQPKQYALLAGKAVLLWCLETFSQHPAIRRIVPVIHPDDQTIFASVAKDLSIEPPVIGGATRQDSVLRGLEALAASPPTHVLIHDGARPGLDAGVIDRVIAGLDHAPGVIPTVPVADTLKRVDAHGRIMETVPRANLRAAQTPQGFQFDKLLAAHRAARGQDLTDDAAVLERAGFGVLTVAGNIANTKITTMDDLRRMTQTLLETRVGTGFDVHRFGNGDHVMLCGIRVAHTQALMGHSDADVALHAATDAVLGAIGAADIGAHFPPSNAAYKDAASDQFLAYSMTLLRAKGGQLLHLDVTIICEQPKVGPHREAMVNSVARICGVDASRISVKATTTEGLGFTGRSEGIAAQATATVCLPRSH
jgi:2-C-methyl-D-erythritol 4-phosphate cytidylyltransferase / 2-C-methyl-D-erythritol 2,4-cyclodiphosphate synthase